MRLIYVPSDDHRRELATLRAGRTEKEYLRAIWKMRDSEQGPIKKSGSGWPFVRLCHKSNVTKLPSRKQKAASD